MLPAFFASGFAVLMHKVIWARLQVSLIGATAYAQAIVLAATLLLARLPYWITVLRIDAQGVDGNFEL